MIINKRSSNQCLCSLGNCPIKFRTDSVSGASPAIRLLITFTVNLGNRINFGNITSAASRTAAGKFIGYPRVAVCVSLMRESLRHTVFVMHTNVVILIEQLSKSITRIILLLVTRSLLKKVQNFSAHDTYLACTIQITSFL